MNKIFNVKSKLLSKVKITDKTYEFIYEAPSNFIFTPGQFVGLRVLPHPMKAYSIISVNNNKVTLLIDINTKSRYFEQTIIGDELNLMGPYGIYKVKETLLDKVFIATGSGVAPFISMLDKLKETSNHFKDIKVTLFFGCRYIKDDLAWHYLSDFKYDNFKYIRCVTMPESQIQDEQGRVTSIVPKHNIYWENTEFYICGSSNMVTEMNEILKNLGANKIYVEKFD